MPTQPTEKRCRVCDCTEADCTDCVERDENSIPCHWEEDMETEDGPICSTCVDHALEDLIKAHKRGFERGRAIDREGREPAPDECREDWLEYLHDLTYGTLVVLLLFLLPALARADRPVLDDFWITSPTQAMDSPWWISDLLADRHGIVIPDRLTIRPMLSREGGAVGLNVPTTATATIDVIYAWRDGHRFALTYYVDERTSQTKIFPTAAIQLISIRVRTPHSETPAPTPIPTPTPPPTPTPTPTPTPAPAPAWGDLYRCAIDPATGWLVQSGIGWGATATLHNDADTTASISLLVTLAYPSDEPISIDGHPVAARAFAPTAVWTRPVAVGPGPVTIEFEKSPTLGVAIQAVAWKEPIR